MCKRRKKITKYLKKKTLRCKIAFSKCQKNANNTAQQNIKMVPNHSLYNKKKAKYLKHRVDAGKLDYKPLKQTYLGYSSLGASWLVTIEIQCYELL